MTQRPSTKRPALGLGYRHVDTAAAYGNERGVGDAVRRSGLNRAEVFLETKIWISDYGYDETLHGFQKSPQAGRRPDRPAHPAPAPPVGVRQDAGVNQIEVHPYFAQREVQAFGAEHGILTQAWSPIGGITFYRDGNHGSTLQDPVISRRHTGRRTRR